MPAWRGKELLGHAMTGEPADKTVTTRAGRFAALPGNVRGALWLLVASVLFTVMIVLAKFLGNRLDSFQVAFFRALVGLIVILPFLLRAGADGGGFRTKVLPVQLSRGVVGSLAMLCGFYAITHLPLADAQSLSFARALFLVPLAALLIGEAVGMRRIVATLVGFCGVVIMLRPTGTVEPAAIVALTGAVFVALAIILVKIASRHDKPVTLMFYTGFVGVFVTAIPAFLAWVPPTWVELALLGLMGATGAAAHNCFIRGYAAGDATAVAPFEYSVLIFAAIGGFFVFGDVPDLWTGVGAAVIVGSSLYIVRREAQLAKEPPPKEAPPVA